jgi:site-specific DNA-methyltransferase (adenine-specific)
VTPYFEGDGITIYNARWEDVWPGLGIQHNEVALLWADPPYGVGEKTFRRSRSRGINKALDRGGHRARARDWDPVVGDDQPFDPSPLLLFPRRVLWGANNYANRLPPTTTWWWWDKRAGTTSDDNADGELAWTNLGGPSRQFTHLWRGLCQDSEKAHGGRRLHPTQKPKALSSWGFQQAKLRRGDLVFSPYLGSGPEAASAREMGLRLIGCEMVEAYCAAAVSRLRQQVLL